MSIMRPYIRRQAASRRGWRPVRIALLALCPLIAAAPAVAQPAGLDPLRDCQVVRACNFTKGGLYRGCISAYSCRVCRFVPGSCRGLPGPACRQLRCTWQ